MASNSDFSRCKEERNRQSFLKVLRRVDVSSEKHGNNVLNSPCSMLATLHVLMLCKF
ncbi:unnamed protein product [Arabidopsis halleri]